LLLLPISVGTAPDKNEGVLMNIRVSRKLLENWGVAGGKPANEVDLGFNINV
jgi:hypothetical protein